MATPSTFDPVATVALVITLTLATVTGGCPERCECTQTYYVYCQRIGLTSEHVVDLVTSIPNEALLLDLSFNAMDQLSSGVFDPVPNLEYLYLSDNHVHSLGLSIFHHQVRLKELSLDNNRMTEISTGVFVNMSNLRKLRLNHNTIGGIENRAFSLPGLRELYLQSNKLTRLHPPQLYGLTSLGVLDLSDNWIQSIEVGTFQGLPNLHTLVLSRNRLSSLAENVFEGLSSLRELYLDGNMLPSLDCFNVPNFANTLQTLILSNNTLVAVPRDVFSRMKNLKILTLDHNEISFIGNQAFKDLHLDNLTLSNNYLEIINRDIFEGSRRISKLDLSCNRIHTIKTGAFDSFRESVYILNLAVNNLKTLDHGMFRGMQNLQTLNLSSNVLSSILENTFEQLTQLNTLVLDHNQLQWLSSDLLKGPSLWHLSVMDNPLTEIRGFRFEDVDHPVKVMVNLTLHSATLTSVHVTWPFRQGSQLYWTLSVWCVPVVEDSSCDSPLLQSSLSPNKVSETVVGLQAGRGYFICVEPTFLSRDVSVSQCGHVSTLQHQPTTVTPRNPASHTSSGGGTQRVNIPTLLGCVLIVVLTSVIFTNNQGLTMFRTMPFGEGGGIFSDQVDFLISLARSQPCDFLGSVSNLSDSNVR